MIPGLLLIEKMVSLAIDLFISNSTKNKELKENLKRFFRKTSRYPKESADMYKEYKDIREKKEWNNKKNN